MLFILLDLSSSALRTGLTFPFQLDRMLCPYDEEPFRCLRFHPPNAGRKHFMPLHALQSVDHIQERLWLPVNETTHSGQVSLAWPYYNLAALTYMQCTLFLQVNGFIICHPGTILTRSTSQHIYCSVCELPGSVACVSRFYGICPWVGHLIISATNQDNDCLQGGNMQYRAASAVVCFWASMTIKTTQVTTSQSFWASIEMCRLPPEQIYAIIHGIGCRDQHATHTLRTCSLVCQSWHVRTFTVPIFQTRINWFSVLWTMRSNRWIGRRPLDVSHKGPAGEAGI
jgi:hypothetical protein